MKDGLDRAGMKDKNGKIFMHWNVSLDALSGSARFVRVWTTGLMCNCVLCNLTVSILGFV